MHKKLPKYLETALRDIIKKKNYLEVRNVNKDPLKIPDPSPKRFCLNYKPDFCIRNTRTGKHIVFEMLDTQDDTKTIADVVRCVFFKKCKKVVFIANNEDRRKEAQSVIDTILENFRRIPKDKRPKKKDVLNVGSFVINIKKQKKTEIIRIFKNIIIEKKRRKK